MKWPRARALNRFVLRALPTGHHQPIKTIATISRENYNTSRPAQQCGTCEIEANKHTHTHTPDRISGCATVNWNCVCIRIKSFVAEKCAWSALPFRKFVKFHWLAKRVWLRLVYQPYAATKQCKRIFEYEMSREKRRNTSILLLISGRKNLRSWKTNRPKRKPNNYTIISHDSRGAQKNALTFRAGFEADRHKSLLAVSCACTRNMPKQWTEAAKKKTIQLRRRISVGQIWFSRSIMHGHLSHRTKSNNSESILVKGHRNPVKLKIAITRWRLTVKATKPLNANRCDQATKANQSDSFNAPRVHQHRMGSIWAEGAKRTHVKMKWVK